MPQLALCSAGSLLGVHLSPASFPVGKVDLLSMHPMSFIEFLMALKEDKSIEILNSLTSNSQIPDIVHIHLWECLKWYFIVGGLPEAVAIFRENKEDLFLAFDLVRKKQNELILGYYADIAKHSGKINAMHISRVWQAIPSQLSHQQDGSSVRFKFKNIIPGINRYSRLSGPIDWLEKAGLVIKVPIVNSGQLPFLAYTKDNIFKLYLFDVGILGTMSQLPPKIILDYDYGTYKGYFAENFALQAFAYTGVDPCYSWMEKSAEVEFLREINGSVVPIEIKSGWVTQAKSAKVFSEKYQSIYRVTMSAHNLNLSNKNGVHNYPLYLAELFPIN